MKVKSSLFVKSSASLSDCPGDPLPEYAFTGRSNVGKSSLINMITNRKDLAKTSSTPGKTRLINHFLINDSWFLVDLPGYGYAKTSKKNRKVFGKLIEQYVIASKKMACLFLLVDSRLEPQSSDLSFIKWLGINGVPFVVVFTKTDKISVNRLEKNATHFRERLFHDWDELPRFFYTSSAKREGGEEILEFIDETNRAYRLTNKS